MDLKKQAIKLVKEVLIHRRNNHIKQEQKAHEKLLQFCEKHNLEFNNVFEGARKEIRKSIANQMNGFI
jgi:2-hydroxy-3-keto-5-methylthiopentenyl-1-phosphate phosphatase